MRDVQDQTREVEVSGLAEVGSFSIAATSKAFKILTDTLYADKPRAIVRELCANAHDSHVAAGIMDRPFKLTLPTKFDTQFSVRDFGVSLTHEQVMQLYTTMFFSTKDADNTQVGKFGLGSKTPFAYTDSFSVIAILNGEKRTYNAFIDAGGIPRIALFTAEPTEEEQGLEITFAVQNKDVSAFEQAARRVMWGFDVKPECNITIQDLPEPVFSGDGWRLYKRDHPGLGYGIPGPMARQGCVLYPVDPASLLSEADAKVLNRFSHSAKVDSAAAALANEALVLDMPIGTVDITPSRESLSYDPTTIKNLIEKLEIVIRQLGDKLCEQVKEAPSQFEAMKIWHHIQSGIINQAVARQIYNKLRWRGRMIPDCIRFEEKQFNRLEKAGVKLQNVRIDHISRGSSSRVNLNDRPHFRILPNRGAQNIAYFTGANPPAGYKARLREFCRNTPGDHFVIENFDPKSYGAKILAVWLGRPTDLEKWFTDLTTITLPPSTPMKRMRASLRVFDGSRFTRKSVPKDTDDNVFWINTCANIPMINDLEVDQVSIKRIWDALLNNNLIDAKSVLVGCPVTWRDGGGEPPEKWNSFEDKLREVFTSKFDLSKLGLGRATEDTNDRGWISMVETVAKHTALVDKDNLISRVQAQLLSRKDLSLQEALWSSARVLHKSDIFDKMLQELTATTKHHFRRLAPMIKTLKRTYAVASLVVGNGWSIDDNVVELINMIDQQLNREREDDLAWAG